MSRWQHAWYSPIDELRPRLFRVGLLLVLAFDCWLNRVPRAGKYGAGGFNVAHFEWLDRIQPMPSPGLYITVQLVTGLLALVAALTNGPRWMLALVTLGWTWGWSMSLLDAYQHHYLLSLLLVGVTLSRGYDTPCPWAWRLTGVNIGIVYSFAALTKVDGRWLSGELVSQGLGRSLRWVPELATTVGLSTSTGWLLAGLGACLVDLTLGLTYLAAPWRDGSPRRWMGALATIGALLALAFHLSIEYSGFKIELFSTYTIWASLCWLWPLSWLQWADERVRRALQKLRFPALIGHSGYRAEGLLGVAAPLVGAALQLPGAAVAGAITSVVILFYPKGGRTLLFGSLLMWAAMDVLQTRFHYYRFLAQNELRLGRMEPALEALETAALFGELGETRRERLEELREAVSTGTVIVLPESEESAP